MNNDAQATPTGSETNEKGVVAAVVGIGESQANRTVTVTAVSGSLRRTATFQVVGANLTATPLPATIAPGASGRVEYQLNASTTPMSDQTITVTASDGSTVTGKTGSGGEFRYDYIAPTIPGSLNITASAGGVSTTTMVLVQSGTGLIPPAAIAVQSASMAAAPSVVSVNTENTNNRAQLRALFVGANNAAVQNVRVRFDLNADTNGVGGTITSGTDVVYSDVNGVANSSYVPASRSSPTDGVTVRACWSENDFPIGTCPNQATATLTVVSESVSITIGTDALLEVLGRSYVKKFVVQVVDSSGLAKSGVQISPSVDLLQYFKGQWVVVGDKWAKSETATCGNEDLNRNSVLQVYSNGAIEDANNSAFLEPRKADVAISFVGQNTTNSNGQVELKITYPQSVASWIQFNIQVAAGGISGTEGRTNYVDVLPVLAEAIADSEKQPAFRLSPYGTQASPTVVATNPLGQSAALCTNRN